MVTKSSVFTILKVTKSGFDCTIKYKDLQNVKPKPTRESCTREANQTSLTHGGFVVQYDIKVEGHCIRISGANQR